jgi:hypothetical protein
MDFSASAGLWGRSYYHLGATINLDFQAQPNEFFLVFLDGAVNNVPVTFTGVGGFWWLPTTRILLLGAGQLDGSGRGGLAVGIPNDAGLVTAQLFFGGAVAGPRITLTNVVDAIIAQ